MRFLIQLLLLTSMSGSLLRASEELRLDYATYNIESLILKKQGWLEQDFVPQAVTIRWLFSAGSNKANQYLASGSADVASTAGAAALLARCNGTQLKTIYVFAKPAWAALVIPKGSTLSSVKELRGKKIAVTRGTDPFFFLLRALQQAGLSQADVTLVNLQHGDGYRALVQGDVDAWSGLDPFMASAIIKDGARILYQNPDYLSFGVLNAREEILRQHPEWVRLVIRDYERARQWAIDHPADAAAILAEAGKIDIDVARRQLSLDTDLVHDVGIPGAALQKTLESIVPILTSEHLAKPGSDPEQSLHDLIDPSFAISALPAPVSTVSASRP